MQILNKIKKFQRQNIEQNIHALKYAIAYALGYGVALFFHSTFSVWILITIAVVMSTQPIVGQLIQKSLFRLVGSAVGVLLGIATLYLPHTVPMRFIEIIVISFLIVRFVVFKSEERGQVAVLGLVTFSLVVFLPGMNVHFALMRLVDVALAVVICFFVSWLIFPLTARRAVLYTTLNTAATMQDFIRLLYIEQLDRQSSTQLSVVETNLSNGLNKLRAIVRSGQYEKLHARKQFQARFNPVIRYLRAIYQYLIFIDVALSEISEKSPEQAKQLRDELKRIMTDLGKLFEAFSIDKTLKLSSFESGRYTAWFNEIKQVEALSNDPMMSSQKGAIEFALRRIPHCLNKLAAAWNVVEIKR